MKTEKLTYKDLVNNFISNPRDIHTFPLNGVKPSWFYCFVEDGVLCVDVSKEHSPKCGINKIRQLLEKEFDAILTLYFRRLKGDTVSKEATGTTNNQTYWYAAIADTLKEERYVNNG